MPIENSSSRGGKRDFSTTEWSVVLDLVHADRQRAQEKELSPSRLFLRFLL